MWSRIGIVNWYLVSFSQCHDPVLSVGNFSSERRKMLCLLILDFLWVGLLIWSLLLIIVKIQIIKMYWYVVQEYTWAKVNIVLHSFQYYCHYVPICQAYNNIFVILAFFYFNTFAIMSPQWLSSLHYCMY